MRKLVFGDVFKMSKIMSKMQIKIDTTDKAQEEFGVELFFGIIENLHQAEDEVIEFLADLKGSTAEQIKDMLITDLIDEFKQIEGVENFLSQVGQLMKRK